LKVNLKKPDLAIHPPLQQNPRKGLKVEGFMAIRL